ncbi:MAG: hypothetical protein LBG06_02710 [Deltaproteobacteria bacterium]|jgi:hypothetical protein|nr:hypothetical protein [Deltaproteobacteria bacterium]
MALSCAPGQRLSRAQTADPGALERSLEAVKTEFEREAAGIREPGVLRAAAWKAVGLSFLEALAAMDAGRYGEFRDRNTEEIEQLWADAGADWDGREIRAMRLCDDAWTRLAALLAGRAGSSRVLEELGDVMSRHEVTSRRARTGPARLAEAKVFWSNRLAALFPLLAKCLPGEPEEGLADITEDLLNNAEVTAARRDIHYQARMDLLYSNNVRSITSMMFLSLGQPSSPYRADAGALRLSWEDSMANQAFKVSDRISHSLLTAAQLSFPLSHWLASANR